MGHNNTFHFKKPLPEEGKKIWELVKKTDSLDLNSLYHYILISHHFGHSSIAAYKDEEIAGFVTSYFPPQQKETLFVWQVCVDKKFQGLGLGKKMLCHLAGKGLNNTVRYLDATITPSNKASIALFTSTAKELGAPYHFEKKIFTAELFGNTGHEPEILFHIGPIE